MQRRTPKSPYVLVFAFWIFALAAVAAMLTTASVASAGPPASVSAQSTSAPLTSTLVINEVYDSATPANEYFELYNASDTFAENLAGYSIYNKDGSNSLASLPITLTVLQPRQF